MVDAGFTVFIVDDDAAVRESLRLLVRSAGLTAEVHDSAEAFLTAYDSCKPGCLVLAVRMPAMNGLELQKRLVDRGILLPIIVVTGHGDIPMTAQAMRQGAVDVIEKPFDADLLLQRINEALARDACARQVESRRVSALTRFDALTQREREIMTMLVQGKSAKTIALELDLSHKTVQAHRAGILEKVGVSSIPDLIWLAIQAGICDER
jgi:FixJ family two-component response regulator